MKINQIINEFAPAGSGGGTPPRGPRTPGRDPWGSDDSGEDPYSRPEPTHYARSIDYFGRFEADHFDDEVFDKATGVFKGYWDDEEGRVQIGYFKFDDPARTGSDDPGMGWYYEPQNESVAEDQLDEINWRKGLATAAMAAGAMGALSSPAQARVMTDPDGQATPSFAQQMQSCAPASSASSARMPNQDLQTVDTVTKVSNDNFVITHNNKEYQAKIIPKDFKFVPRGGVKVKVAQAQMGERGLGSYVAYLLPNGTAIVLSGPPAEPANETKGEMWRVMMPRGQGGHSERYYVVKGYGKDLEIWRSNNGAGDFVKQADAEAKADELNKGVAEGWKQNLAALGMAGLTALAPTPAAADSAQTSTVSTVTHGTSGDQIVNHKNYKKYYDQTLAGRNTARAHQTAQQVATLKVKADIAKGINEQDIAEASDDPWGPQGNFAGDTPVNVGSATMKNIQIGDTVKYLGQPAQVVAMSKDRERSRITIKKGMGDVTQDVLTSDLTQLGQGMAEGRPREKEADYGADYQDMVDRVKKLAGLGPLKTVWDPQKRVYKTVPRAEQPKK